MHLTQTHPDFTPFGFLPDFYTPNIKRHLVNPIRIYVACLAAYNNGRLHGRWIDAALGENHIWEKVRAMLKTSPEEMAEEWAVHDYEGFEGAPISEWTSFKHIAALAEFIEEHGSLGGALIAHYGGELADAKTALEHYHGEYESLEDYARSLTEETSTVPDDLVYYIDYKAMVRDWENSGDIFTIETAIDEIHIFGAW